MNRQGTHRIPQMAICFALAVTIACWAAASALAAPPSLFWKVPPDGLPGGGAGQFRFPQSVTSNPQNGHLFVADTKNYRIVEMTAWGEFVKTWGWGVVASGPDNKAPRNERQELTVNAGGGTYTLAYFNTLDSTKEFLQKTAPIPYDASAATVQAALEGTGSLAPGDLTVSGPSGGPFTIEFIGPLADFDVPPLGIDATDLSGTAAVKTPQGGGSFEICVPANGDVCQRGQSGGHAPGQLPDLTGGIAVGQNGDVYVYERFVTNPSAEGKSLRVQEFDPAGNFLAMWGGEVNKTKSAQVGTSEAERNLCAKAQVEAGDVCGTGVPVSSGTPKGQFNEGSTEGNKIAVGPSGSVFVGDPERIQRFDPNGAFEGEYTVSGGELSGKVVKSMAMDQAGNFYVTVERPHPHGGEIGLVPDVRKLAPTGEEAVEVAKFPAADPSAVTVDAAGNVYIIDFEGHTATSSNTRKVIAYDKDGNQLIFAGERFAESGELALLGLGTGSGCGIAGSDLYVTEGGSGGETSIRAFGPAPNPSVCPPPAAAPSIDDQYAAAVDTREATLGGKINPRFWPDARYYVEFGTGKCSEGGCDRQAPAPPGSLVTNATISSDVAVQAFLTDLEPATTYHYRFVAQSSGGGPVRGLGGSVGADGAEGTFTTWQPQVADTNSNCPNQTLRTGPSAALPDCRAFEMVSPVDKNGSDILTLANAGTAEPAAFNQSSTDGDRLAYSAFKAFGDARSAPFTSAYLAGRGEDGWSTHSISPPQGPTVFTHSVERTTESQFKAFSPDLCSAWLLDGADQVLAPGAVKGFANIYRRDNCGEEADTYSALTTIAPPHLAPSDYQPIVEGFSADGSRAVIGARDALTPNAPDLAGDALLYEAFGAGKLRLLCILPDGSPVGPASNGCSLGTASGGLFDSTGRSSTLGNAISADGSRIYWSEKALPGNAEGDLYVRVNGKETVRVTSQPAQYWTASDDGSKALYTIGGLEINQGGANLYEFDLAEGQSHLIAGKVDGLLGASEDASRVYLISEEALDGAASAGKPNLYLYEEGQFSFIATVTSVDGAARVSLSPVATEPKRHVSQVSADGQSVVFMSSAPLTGYDNTDLSSGKADAEVYVYDAKAGQLRCASCNPTGQRPAGVLIGKGTPEYWAAARIRTSETELYPSPRILSEDGRRAFFESYDSLSPADTNGKRDVYEWEAPGKGDCTEASSAFSPTNGGCLSLISSGESPDDSQVYAVDADGSDVFISTSSSLLPQDPGLVDVYDARVDGGFPAPLGTSACEGEACQGPLVPPNDPTPASAAYKGPGNPAAPSAKKKKRAKAHRAKHKKTKRHTKAKRGNSNGRAGR